MNFSVKDSPEFGMWLGIDRNWMYLEVSTLRRTCILGEQSKNTHNFNSAPFEL